MAPASAMAMSTPILIAAVLNIVSACGESLSFKLVTACFHAFARVVRCVVVGLAVGVVVESVLLMDESSVNDSVSVVALVDVLLVTTVLSSSSSNIA